MANMSALAKFFALFDNRPEILDSIVSISYIPPESVDLIHTDSVGFGDFNMFKVRNFTTPIQNASYYNVPDKYSGFPAVTESKLLMFPYSFAEVTVYTGQAMEVKIENLSSAGIGIATYGHLAPDSRVAYIVKDYNGQAIDLENSLISDNFPEMPTSRDTYAAWLASSKMSRTAQWAGGTVALAVGIGLAVGTGGLAAVAAAAGGMGTIVNQLAQQMDAERSPNTVNLQAGGNGFNIANDIKGITIKKKMVKPEYRSVLSSFWKSYGYKVNRIKVPNLKTRETFNYIKTVDCNIMASIPEEHLQVIRDMFNRGVTLWHEPDQVGNYGGPNNEI